MSRDREVEAAGNREPESRGSQKGGGAGRMGRGDDLVPEQGLLGLPLVRALLHLLAAGQRDVDRVRVLDPDLEIGRDI